MTFEFVKKIVADATETKPSEITIESSMDDIVGWDSLGHLAIMNALASKYPQLEDDMRLQSLASVKEIVDLINSL
jgi:acyl carrier protein